MSDLTTLAEHARKMTQAEHKPECCRCGNSYCCGCIGHPNMHPTWEDHGMSTGWPQHAETCPGDPSAPPCPGCVTDAERALWVQIAGEIEAYLHTDEEATLL